MKSLKIVLITGALLAGTAAFAAPCAKMGAAEGSNNVVTASAAKPESNNNVVTASAAKPESNNNVVTASADCK